MDVNEDASLLLLSEDIIRSLRVLPWTVVWKVRIISLDMVPSDRNDVSRRDEEASSISCCC
jgi:hypothetical protein